MHPNFLPNSTHGNTLDEIISHIISIWPYARGFRSHSYFDCTFITNKFFTNGHKYDSNICLHLQEKLVPLIHNSGLIRFPVFFEDDVYIQKEGDFNLRLLKSIIETPGLKIFDFHPIHLSLNTPSISYYEKSKIEGLAKYQGEGITSFLLYLLDLIIENHFTNTFYLGDIYDLMTNNNEG